MVIINKAEAIGNRIIGLDFVRALAILGMMLVNFKLLLNASDKGPSLLRLFNNALEGRAAAIFLVLAGIGLSLMIKKYLASNDIDAIKRTKMTIRKRAVFLFILGLILYLIGWSADILHYYGVYMVIASFLIDKKNKTLHFANIAIIVLSQMMLLFFTYELGWDADFHNYYGFWTIKGFFRNLFYNGYHPVFPWISFIITGMWIGRLDLLHKQKRSKILKIAVLIAIGSELLSKTFIKTLAKINFGETLSYLVDTTPMPPTFMYIIAATSTAITAIIVCIELTQKLNNSKLVNCLVKTGQMALTHYVAHVIIGIGVLEVMGMLKTQTLIFSTLYSLIIYVAMIVFSHLWSINHKRGPLESFMRRLSS